MEDFKINEYITLKLEENKTKIYIKGKYFRLCKSLFLDLFTRESFLINEIKSIDEIREDLEIPQESKVNIPPDAEFWGHCSNLQTWYEHNYDTRLIDSKLAFPLLKELVRVGDPLAKKMFKEEIVRRFECGYLPVIFYLMIEEYFDYYLSEEERLSLFLDPVFKENLENNLRKDAEDGVSESYSLLILTNLVKSYNDAEAKKILKDLLLDLLKLNKKEDFNNLVDMNFDFEILSIEELENLLYELPIFLRVIGTDNEIKYLYEEIKDNSNHEENRFLVESLLLRVNYNMTDFDLAKSIKWFLNLQKRKTKYQTIKDLNFTKL